MDRKKLMGYSLNDTYRLRMNTARKLGVSATRIEAPVAGAHCPKRVPVWSLGEMWFFFDKSIASLVNLPEIAAIERGTV